MSDIEQTKAESNASGTGVPPAGNEPPSEHTDGHDAAAKSSNEHRPREPHEKRIREWLIVLFTGTIVAGTLYYASIAKRQADLMSQQRDVMIQQVNASQRQVDEMKTQTGTFDRTLTATQKIEKDTGRQANSSQQSVGVAQQTFRLLERPALGIEGAALARFIVGEPALVQVAIRNFGHVPARNATVLSTVFADRAVSPSTPCPEPQQSDRVIGLGSRSVFAVNGIKSGIVPSRYPIRQEDFDRVMNEKSFWIYIHVMTRYGDGRQYFLEYYARYNADTKSWDECGTHNRAN
jgi:hypothetical protein